MQISFLGNSRDFVVLQNEDNLRQWDRAKGTERHFSLGAVRNICRGIKSRSFFQILTRENFCNYDPKSNPATLWGVYSRGITLAVITLVPDPRYIYKDISLIGMWWDEKFFVPRNCLIPKYYHKERTVTMPPLYCLQLKEFHYATPDTMGYF